MSNYTCDGAVSIRIFQCLIARSADTFDPSLICQFDIHSSQTKEKILLPVMCLCENESCIYK
jgi:hypothetical protein